MRRNRGCAGKRGGKTASGGERGTILLDFLRCNGHDESRTWAYKEWINLPFRSENSGSAISEGNVTSCLADFLGQAGV